ncbi:HlyD family secretion protein [Desulfolithobacter sp.]
MAEEAKKVAVPALLKKDLQAFRVDDGQQQTYIIRDKHTRQSHYFEPWQFFVLEVLVGCEDFAKLSSIFEDRFGRPLTIDEAEKLFEQVEEKKIFRIQAFSHPILEGLKAKKEGKASTATSGKTVSDEELPAGIKDVIGMDDSVSFRGFKLFDPSPLLKILTPLVAPLRYSTYLIPTFFFVSLYIATKYFVLIEQDISYVLDNITFLEHILLGMITVNLAVTIATAFVAHSFRATVRAVCLVFYFGFLPRFMLRIGHVQQLSRRERIWLHATPLVVRIALFSFGILLWYITRGQAAGQSLFGLSLATISGVSFLITANPLIKSSGYYLLSAYANEPYLKEKAYKTLLNKLHGRVYTSADSAILSAYALLSMLCLLTVITVGFYFVGHFLKIQIGPAGILVTALLFAAVCYRIWRQLKTIAEQYERSVQFERWRKRLAPDTSDNIIPGRQKNITKSVVWTSVALITALLLMVPCRYNPGGNFVIIPGKQQEITSNYPGIIKEVYFNGGETVAVDTPIAVLDSSEFEYQRNLYAFKVKEQAAIIDNLKAKPRPEEHLLALRSLEVERTKVKFSEAKLKRARELFLKDAISLEELADIEKQYNVDKMQEEERTANLALTDAGVAREELEAAMAKLQRFKEMRDYYQRLIDQSVLRMPFTGTVTTLQLKQKIGSFLEKGEPFALAENTERVTAQINIPEVDIDFVRTGASAELRPLAYENLAFHGTVTSIGPDITEGQFGKFMSVMVTLENRDGTIRSGMTGYAKIQSDELPLWNILSMGLRRFARIEIWSWLP